MILDGYDYISEQEFDLLWGAHVKPNGDLYFLDEAVSFPHENVWSVYEGEDIDEDGFNRDNHWYASPGIHYVNTLGYLITERPWVDDTHDAIWFLDVDEQSHEERKRDFLEHP